MENFVYIPTTSRNLNNILISRRISPASFYQARGFGVKRFYPVPINDDDNAIRCFSEKVLFNIEHNEYEEDPILIKIPLKLIEDKDNEYVILDHSKAHSVYFVKETIDLGNFENCQIGFFDDDHRTRSIVLAEQALEIKSLHFIKQNFKVISSKFINNPIFEDSYQIKKIDKTTTLSFEKMINHDIFYEQIKGANYCYLIYLSDRYSDIPLLSPDLPIIYKFLSKIVLEKNIFEPCGNDITINAEFDDISASKYIFNSERNIILLMTIMSVIKREGKIYNDDSFKQNRREIVSSIARDFKTVIEDFSNSRERAYIISLINHFESFANFDFLSLDNIVIQSLVPVILYGREIEKIKPYLKSRGVINYGFAYIIWGMIFGYCNIPKTLSDPLFTPSIRNNIVLSNESIPNHVSKDKLIKPVSKFNSGKYSGGTVPLCDCKLEMILREKSGNKFYGCVNFPSGCNKTTEFNNLDIDKNKLDEIINLIISKTSNNEIVFVKDSKDEFFKTQKQKIIQEVITEYDSNIVIGKEGRKATFQIKTPQKTLFD